MESLQQMEELRVELVVLAPNLLAQPTPLDLVDEIAGDVIGHLHASEQAVAGGFTLS